MNKKKNTYMPSSLTRLAAYTLGSIFTLDKRTESIVINKSSYVCYDFQGHRKIKGKLTFPPGLPLVPLFPVSPISPYRDKKPSCDEGPTFETSSPLSFYCWNLTPINSMARNFSVLLPHRRSATVLWRLNH